MNRLIDVKVLRVAYNQYFCNIGELTDEQLATLHAEYSTALTIDPDAEFWELSDDLVIWEPFEYLSPAKVFENIMDGINDIETNLLPQDYIAINPMELASELAHLRILEFVMSEKELWGEPSEDGSKTYKEEHQDEFNSYYDYYLAVLTGTL